MAEHDDDQPGSRRSLIDLIRSFPDLIVRLVRDELRAAREEIVRKTKSFGIGVGILLGAVVVVLFGVGFLLQSGAHALALVLPAWTASLIVGGALVLLAAVLAIVGAKLLKRGAPPVPSETIDSVRKDVDAVTGS